jgi:hypothetical protein
MTRYLWTGDGFVNRSTGEPMQAPERIARPFVMKDVQYASPLSRKMVTSRSQRREEMKVHNVREVDPSEFTPTFENKDRARRERADHEPRKKPDWDTGNYHRPSRADLPKRIERTLARQP